MNGMDDSTEPAVVGSGCVEGFAEAVQDAHRFAEEFDECT